MMVNSVSLKTAQNVEMYYYCKHAQTIKLIITYWRFSGWCRRLSGACSFALINQYLWRKQWRKMISRSFILPAE